MPRPSKRAIASRKASVKSVEAMKRRRLAASEAFGVPDSGPSESELSAEATSSTGTLVSSQLEISEGVPSEGHVLATERVLQLSQPARDWTYAERKLPGYSKTNTGKTRQSQWYHKKKQGNQEKEKEQLLRSYGNISRFFNVSGSTAIIGSSRSSTAPVPGPRHIHTPPSNHLATLGPVLPPTGRQYPNSQPFVSPQHSILSFRETQSDV
jgi:hypothetical protein